MMQLFEEIISSSEHWLEVERERHEYLVKSMTIMDELIPSGIVIKMYKKFIRERVDEYEVALSAIDEDDEEIEVADLFLDISSSLVVIMTGATADHIGKKYIYYLNEPGSVEKIRQKISEESKKAEK